MIKRIKVRLENGNTEILYLLTKKQLKEGLNNGKIKVI